MAKKVFIGVGHGGTDSGAVANGIKEKNANLDIAMACAETLERHGVTVKMSREKDESESLSTRIKECNAFKPDVACDIHNNAGGGDGAEVFHAKNDKSDDALAQNILEEIVKIGQNSRGLKTKLAGNGTDYFGFIRQCTCPSVLVECAFLDNANDVKIIDTLAERKAMGVAIAKGILKTLGIAYTEKTESKPTAVNKTFKAGDVVKLSNTPLYASSTTTKASSNKTGTFYIWGVDVVNNRIRITNSKSNVGKTGQVTGWIDVSAVGGTTTKPATSTPKTYKKGDAVKLTKTPLYISASSKNAVGTKTGTYFIYDGVKTNGRYRITNKAKNCGRKPAALYVTGWVKL